MMDVRLPRCHNDDVKYDKFQRNQDAMHEIPPRIFRIERHSGTKQKTRRVGGAISDVLSCEIDDCFKFQYHFMFLVLINCYIFATCLNGSSMVILAVWHDVHQLFFDFGWYIIRTICFCMGMIQMFVKIMLPLIWR